MSRVYAFILGKGKDELEKMLVDVQKRIASDPMNESLKEEEAAIRVAIEEATK